eukprot:29502-Pelagococcus_subviridis.AAC.4
MDVRAHWRLNPEGRVGDHSTVMFGSGAAPRLASERMNRQEVLVTRCRDSAAAAAPPPPPPRLDSPAIAHVAHTGSPAKISSYAFGLSCRINRSLITK